MLTIWRRQIWLVGLAILAVSWAALLGQAIADPSESLRCKLKVKTASGSKPENPIWGDRDTYMLSVGSLFNAIALAWFSDRSVCGGYIGGAIRVEAVNYAEGRLRAYILSEKDGQPRKLLYSADLRKRLTDRLVIWEGDATAPDGSATEPIYIKRIRKVDTTEVPRINDMQRDPGFQIRAGHGAYYCGDGGCDGLEVDVLVPRQKEEAFVRRLRQSGIDYTSFKRKNTTKEIPCIHDHVDPALLDKSDTVCFEVVAMPLREPEVTMALRAFPEVRIARRRGGGAGSDATSFFIETKEFLKDASHLDVGVAVRFFDRAMRKYYPDSPNYDISDPIFRNNSLFWNIKGRRSALERLSHPSPASRSEWWKVRVQLMIQQKNFGEYFMAIGLPVTRIATWGFDAFPSDAKFSELDNDPRFNDFRDRLMGALTKEVAGTIFLP